MRVPRVKFTIKRILIVAGIISVAASLVVGRVTTLGSSMWWVLVSLGLASPFWFSGFFLVDVLSIRRHQGESAQRPVATVPASSRPQFTLLQLMFATAIVTVMCWFAAMLFPIWWAAFHEPTDAEMAQRFRQDAALDTARSR